MDAFQEVSQQVPLHPDVVPLKTSDFDYELPPELIAQTPIEPRDSSRLLVLNRAEGTIQHHRFYELPSFLRPGDVLVANDSRVVPARIFGRRRPSGGKVEVLLLHRLEPGLWQALVRPAKPLTVGAMIDVDGAGGSLEVTEAGEGGIRVVRLSDEGLIDSVGRMPLPPYIHAPLEEPERYQTVYARVRGSAAAPTAGLHFTDRLLDSLAALGVELAFVTLHIGLDTFRQVRHDDPRQHAIHSEYCELSSETAMQLNKARAEGRRVICVGTTAVRVVESAAQASGQVQPFSGWTKLFILPGYRFRAVDALITNFHLPRSTLLMLVSAFAGTDLMRRAYREAIAKRYRFYSFGDAMLVR